MFDTTRISAGQITVEMGSGGDEAVRVIDGDWKAPGQKRTLAEGSEGSRPLGPSEYEDRAVTLTVDGSSGSVPGDGTGWVSNLLSGRTPLSSFRGASSGQVGTAYTADGSQPGPTTVDYGVQVWASEAATVTVKVKRGSTDLATKSVVVPAKTWTPVQGFGVSTAGGSGPLSLTVDTATSVQPFGGIRTRKPVLGQGTAAVYFDANTPGATQATSTNLATNPKFTSNATGYTADITAGMTQVNAGRAVMPDNASQFGYRLNFTNTTAAARVAGIVTATDAVPVQPGDSITLRAEFYAVAAPAGNTARVMLQFYNAAGTNVGASPTQSEALSVGGRVVAALTYAVPATAVTARLGLHVSSTTASTFDVYVTRIIATVNLTSTVGYYDGDSPGWRWTGTAGNSTSTGPVGPIRRPANGEPWARAFTQGLQAAMGAVGASEAATVVRDSWTGSTLTLDALSGICAVEEDHEWWMGAQQATLTLSCRPFARGPAGSLAGIASIFEATSTFRSTGRVPGDVPALLTASLTTGGWLASGIPPGGFLFTQSKSLLPAGLASGWTVVAPAPGIPSTPSNGTYPSAFYATVNVGAAAPILRRSGALAGGRYHVLVRGMAAPPYTNSNEDMYEAMADIAIAVDRKRVTPWQSLPGRKASLVNNLDFDLDGNPWAQLNFGTVDIPAGALVEIIGRASETTRFTQGSLQVYLEPFLLGADVASAVVETRIARARGTDVTTLQAGLVGDQTVLSGGTTPLGSPVITSADTSTTSAGTFGTSAFGNVFYVGPSGTALGLGDYQEMSLDFKFTANHMAASTSVPFTDFDYGGGVSLAPFGTQAAASLGATGSLAGQGNVMANFMPGTIAVSFPSQGGATLQTWKQYPFSWVAGTWYTGKLIVDGQGRWQVLAGPSGGKLVVVGQGQTRRLGGIAASSIPAISGRPRVVARPQNVAGVVAADGPLLRNLQWVKATSALQQGGVARWAQGPRDDYSGITNGPTPTAMPGETVIIAARKIDWPAPYDTTQTSAWTQPGTLSVSAVPRYLELPEYADPAAYAVLNWVRNPKVLKDGSYWIFSSSGGYTVLNQGRAPIPDGSGRMGIRLNGTNTSAAIRDHNAVSSNPYTEWMPVVPGRTYYFGAETYSVAPGTGSSLRVNPVFVQADGSTAAGTTTGSTPLVAGRQVFSISYVAPAGAAWARVQAGIRNTLPETIDTYITNFWASPRPGSYGDGDLPGWRWTGTPNDSTSEGPAY